MSKNIPVDDETHTAVKKAAVDADKTMKQYMRDHFVTGETQ